MHIDSAGRLFVHSSVWRVFVHPCVYPTLFRLSFCTPLTLINVATTPVGGNKSPTPQQLEMEIDTHNQKQS